MQTFYQRIRRFQIKRTFLLFKFKLVGAVIKMISTYCFFRYKELALIPCANGKNGLAIKYDKQCLVTKHDDVVLSDPSPNKKNGLQ